MKWLVVDNDPDFRESMTALLVLNGHTAYAAKDCTSGLALLVEHEDADAMILDVRMLGESGIRCLEKVRQTHPLLPVVLGTGLTDAEVRPDAHTRLLVKPFTLEQVMGALAEMGGR